jgi:hypothetical protein
VIAWRRKVSEKGQQFGGGRFGQVLEDPGVTAEDDADEGSGERRAAAVRPRTSSTMDELLVGLFGGSSGRTRVPS